MSQPPFNPENPNPHPYDDSEQQWNNPDYPADTYPMANSWHNPAEYERIPGRGQREYYADRRQAMNYMHEQERSKYEQWLHSQSTGGAETPASAIPERRLRGPFPVAVDYNLSPEEMIDGGGYAFDYCYSNILQYIREQRETGVREIDIHLVAFGWKLPNADVPDILGRMGARAVTVPELLAFGADYPDFQRAHPVLAANVDMSGKEQYFGGTLERRTGALSVGLTVDRNGVRMVDIWHSKNLEESYIRPNRWLAIVPVIDDTEYMQHSAPRHVRSCDDIEDI